MKLGSWPEADNLGLSVESVSNDGATPDGYYTLDGTILCFVLAFQDCCCKPTNRTITKKPIKRQEY